MNLLSVASFANIFSYSLGYLFILFKVSSAVQKHLSLIRPHLFIFGFISFWVGLWRLLGCGFFPALPSSASTCLVVLAMSQGVLLSMAICPFRAFYLPVVWGFCFSARYSVLSASSSHSLASGLFHDYLLVVDDIQSAPQPFLAVAHVLSADVVNLVFPGLRSLVVGYCALYSGSVR